MRLGSVSALVLTGFALAACGGGEFGDTTCGTLDIAASGPCVAAATPTAPVAGAPTAPTGEVGTSAGGGNTTVIPTGAAGGGNVTLAYEGADLSHPKTGTALSKLAFDPLAAVKPTQQKFLIDSKTTTNNYWATPVLMDEYVPGTTAPGPGNNGGAGNNYREYRALSKAGGRDEVLQVWAWDQSYAAQYLNQSGGGEGRQHAWMFGGNATPAANVPTGGTATYNGRFVAVAKTQNYASPPGTDINPNALWRVQGASTLTADFGAATVNGTLSPETWTSYQSKLPGNYTKTVGVPEPAASGIVAPNFHFYDTKVGLKGTIDPTAKNTFSGTSTLTGKFKSYDNPMNGGFFGTGAAETAGVFGVEGVEPDPIGGSAGITDPRAGYLTIDGAFHGCNPVCP